MAACVLLLSTGAGRLSAAPKTRDRRPSPLSDSLRLVRKTPSPAAREAFRKFYQKQGKGWKVRYNPRTALPEALTGGRTARYPGTPEAAAAAFFEDNKELLKVEPSALRLTLKKEFLGITHLQYQQYKDGIPVEFSYARVHVSASGEVSGYQGKFEPEILINTVPGISGEAAAIAANADAGRQLSVSGTELVIFPDENAGALKLAWKIRGRGAGLWVYYISAADGTVLLKYDDLRYACTGITYGTSVGTVYAVSPLSSYTNTVKGSLDVSEDLWEQPEAVQLRDQYFWAGGYSSMTVTNASGCYSTNQPGKVFSSLKGPYFAVTNFRGASAHYDNGSGEWRTVATPVQTPHPYVDSHTYTYQVNVVPSPPLASNEIFAKAMPQFTKFQAGSLDGDGNVNDADQVYIKSGSSVMGAYIGQRTAPFLGAAVENPSYTISLESDASGVSDGFAVDVSSYLVLKNYTTSSNSSGSVVWSTSTAGVYLDRSLGDANALSEVNAFYHLNAIHRYFDGINRNPNKGDAPAADLSRQVAVMVHASGEPDTLPGVNGMKNAYYDLEKDYIVIGDGQRDNSGKYRSFALDGTIVRHEYIHLVVNRIYPIINFGEFGAISEAMADYFSLTSFWREGRTDKVTLGNFVGAGEGAARDISASGKPTNIKKMPGDWAGEVHDDSLILSQALYRLGNLNSGSNYLGTFGAGSFSGQYKADALVYAALFYFPDNFSNFRDAMLDACDQFNILWGGECNGTVKAKISAAFLAQGIASAASGDSYETGTSGLCENNNGPECASDISSLSSLSATVYPLGDVDYYSLPLSAGDFSARLDLPVTGTENVYHAYSMFIFDSNRQYVTEASPVIYGTGSDACDDSGSCSTLAPSVTLNYNVPYGGGRYYLVVSAAPNQYYGNSEDYSSSPYILTLSRAPQGSANARLNAAVFDNDEIAFDVPYPDFAMLGSPSSATLTGAELGFEYAQLRDHNYEPISLTRSNLSPTYLLNVASSLSYSNTDSLGRHLISGRVQLQPGFATRYPGVGTVYLEIFGRNHMGQVLSLGVSNPLNLSAAGSGARAYNNLITGSGGKALIKYSVTGTGTVSIKIYTPVGALVKTITDSPNCGNAACTGSKDWDGTNSNGAKVASGIYFVKVKGPGLDKIVKIAVIR